MIAHRFTVLDEFDGKPFRRFHDAQQAAHFAAGRPMEVAPRARRPTRKEILRQALAEVGPAKF